LSAVGIAMPLQHSGAFDLSDRAKFRVTGADRIRFLNGQLTNDVRKATAGWAIEACVLSAKGKIDAHVFVSVEPEAVFLDADAGLRETLPARLDRYIIADDVQVEDITDEFSIFHVIGDRVDAERTVRAARFATVGQDFWVAAAKRETARQELATTATIHSAQAMETLRIELGQPRWGRELTSDVLPHEANLEASCVDYGKGCYIGQEVVSRMKMSGQTRSRLCGLTPVSDEPLEAGMKLTDNSDSSKQVGQLTSAAFSEKLGRHIALAYVKRGFNAIGVELQALAEGRSALSVKVVELPFAR
jgi:folate-binding protein YgfZ